MVPWRERLRKYPLVTLLRDAEAYADVFDAIEEARGRARTWEPSPTDFVSLGKLQVIDARTDDNEPGAEGAPEARLEDFVVCKVPVVPVRVPNTVRLCVGLL